MVGVAIGELVGELKRFGTDVGSSVDGLDGAEGSSLLLVGVAFHAVHRKRVRAGAGRCSYPGPSGGMPG